MNVNWAFKQGLWETQLLLNSQYTSERADTMIDWKRNVNPPKLADMQLLLSSKTCNFK